MWVVLFVLLKFQKVWKEASPLFVSGWPHSKGSFSDFPVCAWEERELSFAPWPDWHCRMFAPRATCWALSNHIFSPGSPPWLFSSTVPWVLHLPVSSFSLLPISIGFHKISSSCICCCCLRGVREPSLGELKISSSAAFNVCIVVPSRIIN